jgi:hypothetical protein
MNRIIAISVFFLILPLVSISQDMKQDLVNTQKEYVEVVRQKDHSKTLDYIYPGLFDIIPRDKMLMALESVYADTTVVITMDDFSLGNTSDFLELDGINYALVEYSFVMKMMISRDPEYDEEEDRESMEFTNEMLKMSYGEDNVNYISDERLFTINVSNEMYAILDPQFQGWKFLDKKEKMMPILEKILPKKVIKKLD